MTEFRRVLFRSVSPSANVSVIATGVSSVVDAVADAEIDGGDPIVTVCPLDICVSNDVFTTVTVALPEVAKLIAGTTAVRVVADTTVLTRATPFQRSEETPETNPVPLQVMVWFADPVGTTVGETADKTGAAFVT